MSWLLIFRKATVVRMALTGALACIHFSALAVEWSVEPSVSLREEYNDNIRLTTLPHNSVWLTKISPAVNLSGKSETLSVSGGARVNLNRYSGENGLDKNDQMFNLSSVYKTERDNWGVDASYTRDSTLESELVQTGYVLPRRERKSTSLAPSWTRSLTERLKLTAGYQYSNAKYENEPTLADYAYQKVNGVLQYVWSEQDQFFLVASYDKVEQASVTYTYSQIFPFTGQDVISGNESKTRNFLVGMSHVFSESLSGVLKIGRRSTQSTAVHTCNGDIAIPECTYNILFDPLITFRKDSQTSGSSLDATLDKQFETMKISGQASRDTKASGSGLVETDRFGISVSDRLSHTVTGNLDISVYRTKYLGDIALNSNSRYYSIAPRLSWRITEWWTLDTGYRYARQKYENASSAATANVVYVNLVYNWPKISVSR